ncbi:MAG TPA: hypothetical protein VHT30_01555 [Acidimicrobiales bacterium]|nr:hypothetical protein [Acidimicrobiales bacterium]
MVTAGVGQIPVGLVLDEQPPEHQLYDSLGHVNVGVVFDACGQTLTSLTVWEIYATGPAELVTSILLTRHATDQLIALLSHAVPRVDDPHQPALWARSDEEQR